MSLQNVPHLTLLSHTHTHTPRALQSRDSVHTASKSASPLPFHTPLSLYCPFEAGFLPWVTQGTIISRPQSPLHPFVCVSFNQMKLTKADVGAAEFLV